MIAYCQIAEYCKSLIFSYNQIQDDDWVSHSLHVAHIWPEDMEYF